MNITTKIKNSDGNGHVVLNAKETRLVNMMQKQSNSLGYEIDISSLTGILKRVVEQKFFEVAPGDYFPIKVGEGAWTEQLTSYRSFQTGDSFEAGLINTGSDNSRLAKTDVAIDSVSLKVNNWAKTIGWTLFDVELATRSGNWDIVTEKEKSRKKNWDLGIQRIAFLGAEGDSGTRGLLNQVGITEDTAVITKPISKMSPEELKAFVASIMVAYRDNNSRTAWPDVFVIPESDYLGLASQSSPQFPIKTVLEVIEDALKTLTKKPGFKIMPLTYADAEYNNLGKQVYALYSYSDSSLRMDIPVNYTNTLANSIDNFSFQNVGYGQFTGALAYRPEELLYFTHTL